VRRLGSGRLEECLKFIQVGGPGHFGLDQVHDLADQTAQQ